MPGRKPTVTDKEILQEVALAPDPIVTAPELAERVGMTRQGINKRLDQLADEGLIEERTVGSRAVVYWLSEEGKDVASS